MVWPITGANLTSPETGKLMKRGKLAIAQEDCWRNTPLFHSSSAKRAKEKRTLVKLPIIAGCYRAGVKS
jgi:hypothetical protein